MRALTLWCTMANPYHNDDTNPAYRALGLTFGQLLQAARTMRAVSGYKGRMSPSDKLDMCYLADSDASIDAADCQGLGYTDKTAARAAATAHGYMYLSDYLNDAYVGAVDKGCIGGCQHCT